MTSHLLLGLLLREADHRDLGVCEASRGDGQVVYLVVPAAYVLHGTAIHGNPTQA